MFESTFRSGRTAAKCWTTAAVSATAHITVLTGIAVCAMYATDTLPTPQHVMAFVVEAAAIPPAPPAPAPAAAPKAVKKTVSHRDAPKPLTPQPTIAAAAPVEAPSEISPETGLEGLRRATGAVAAGFESGVPGGVIGGLVGAFENALPAPPPAPPRINAPVRVGGEITAPRVLRRVNPQYPLIAQNAAIAGIVILEATVSREGRVDAVRVLRSHSLLEEAAVAALKQWLYEPLMLNGQPQPFVVSITISFSVPTHDRRASIGTR